MIQYSICYQKMKGERGGSTDTRKVQVTYSIRNSINLYKISGSTKSQKYEHSWPQKIK